MANSPRTALFHFDSDVPFIVRLVAALELKVPGLHVRRVALTEHARIPAVAGDDFAIVVISNESAIRMGAQYLDSLLRGLSSDTRVILISDGTAPPWALSLKSHHTIEFDTLKTKHTDLDFQQHLQLLIDCLFNKSATIAPDEAASSALAHNILVESEDGSIALNPALFLQLSDLDIGGPARQALRENKLFFVGDIVALRRSELLAKRGVSQSAVGRLEDALGRIGLALGSDVPGWPPERLQHDATRVAIARRVSEIQQAPLGARFEADAQSLFINPAGEDTDFKVAKTPLVQQLHEAIVRKANQFASVAGRLDNQTGWQGIASLGGRLVFLLNRPTHEIPEVLGSLYSSALELGSFLELDHAISTGASPYSVALDPEARRPLEDLVRSLAPWIRSFPTIRQMDDEAGQFLAKDAMLRRSEQVIKVANDVRLIRKDDAAALIALMDSADRGDFQGGKAGHRGVLSVRNMIIASAGVLSSFLLGAVSSDYATKSLVVQKAGSFLALGEAAISEVLGNLPHDLQFAIQALMKDLRDAPIIDPTAPRPVANPQPPVRGRREKTPD
jgi:hypothetical protein